MGEQKVHAVRLASAVGIHGQFLAECLLFPPVGKPVVDTNFCHQIRTQAMCFRGGHTPLEAFCPGEKNEEDTLEEVAINWW